MNFPPKLNVFLLLVSLRKLWNFLVIHTATKLRGVNRKTIFFSLPKKFFFAFVHSQSGIFKLENSRQSLEFWCVQVQPVGHWELSLFDTPTLVLCHHFCSPYYWALRLHCFDHLKHWNENEHDFFSSHLSYTACGWATSNEFGYIVWITRRWYAVQKRYKCICGKESVQRATRTINGICENWEHWQECYQQYANES